MRKRAQTWHCRTTTLWPCYNDVTQHGNTSRRITGSCCCCCMKKKGDTLWSVFHQSVLALVSPSAKVTVQVYGATGGWDGGHDPGGNGKWKQFIVSGWMFLADRGGYAEAKQSTCKMISSLHPYLPQQLLLLLARVLVFWGKCTVRPRFMGG